MDILFLVVMILLGLLFLVVELLLLPGVSIGGFLSVACFGGAIYMAFDQLGVTEGVVVVAISLAISIVAVTMCLRSKTWERLSLKSELDSAPMPQPKDLISVGAVGVTVSRLSPMGKISVDNKIYEAKSGGQYIDARVEVEVVGFENSSVIVRVK